MSVPQRVYVYLTSFVAFAVLLQGVYGLGVDVALSLTWSGPDTGDRATWIAMLIVGLPVWLVHDLLGRRALIRSSDEAASALRKLYVHGALVLTTLYVFYGAQRIVDDLTGDSTGLEHLAAVPLAAGFWFYLWRRDNIEGQTAGRAQTIKRWRIYGLSVLFLATAVAGTLQISLSLAFAVYDSLFDSQATLIASDEVGDVLQTAAAWALIGSAAWAIQWRAVATRDEESTLRQVYLYGFAFIGGAMLSLWGAAATLYVIISRLLGVDDTSTTVEFFRQFIMPIVSLLIGLVLLAYHWSVIQRDAARRTTKAPTTLGFTFRYIMSAVGLISLIPGLSALLAVILSAFSSPLFAAEADDTEILAVALTLIVMGAPLWYSFWWRVVRADPLNLIRRIYLYVALIALGGAALFSLIGLLATILTELLAPEGMDLLNDTTNVLLATLLPVAAFFLYHVTVLRDDARRAPRPEPPSLATPSTLPSPPKRIIIAATQSLANAVIERLRMMDGQESLGQYEIEIMPLRGDTESNLTRPTPEAIEAFSTRLTNDLQGNTAGMLVVIDRQELRAYPLANDDDSSG